jgi:spectinomycin phosphotransferase/16S rRNA (guanine(1405)-N(7))-methyltransferase
MAALVMVPARIGGSPRSVLAAEPVVRPRPDPGLPAISPGSGATIDWDTALVAPPERDLWDLDPGDGTFHAAYASATGTRLRPDLLELYQIRWDLTEIAACLNRFHEPHANTADDQEAWSLLTELVLGLLRPAS